MEAAAKRDTLGYIGVTPEKGQSLRDSKMSAHVSPTAARAAAVIDNRIDQWKQ